MFYSLVEADLKVGDFGIMALATVLVIAGFAILGGFVLRMLRLSIRAYLPSIIFSNSGNMGLPLCLLAFGEAGLALAIVLFAVSAIQKFTIGIAI